MKKSLYLILVVILSSFVYGAIGYITTISNGLSEQNITTYKSNVSYFFLDLPRYGYFYSGNYSQISYVPQKMSGFNESFNRADSQTIGNDWIEVQGVERVYIKDNTLIHNGSAGLKRMELLNKNINQSHPKKVKLSMKVTPVGGGTNSHFDLSWDTTVGIRLAGFMDFGVIFAGSDHCNYTFVANKYANITLDLDWTNYVYNVSVDDKLTNCSNTEFNFDVPYISEVRLFNNNGADSNMTYNYINITNGDFTEKTNNSIAIDMTYINTTLKNGCTCGNCTIVDTYFCRLGFNISYYDNSTTNIRDINFTFGFGFDNCSNKTFEGIPTRAHAVNFTFKTEKNLSTIQADINSEYNYTIDNINYGFFEYDFTDKWNYSLCIYPNYAEITSNYEILYSAEPEFPQRRYATNTILDSSTNLNDLFLLFFADGIYVRFRTVDQSTNPIEEVLVSMSDTGTTDLIESDYTDDSGLVTFWVDPDNEYTFQFIKTGFQTSTQTIRPTSSEIYNVVMGEQTTDVTASYFSGLDYEFSPRSVILQNGTNYTFAFNITSSYWDITNCVLRVQDENETILTAVNGVYNIRSCNASLNRNTSDYTRLWVQGIVELNDTTNLTLDPILAVGYTYEGEFSLKNFFDDLSSFEEAGFDSFTLMFIAFVIIFALVVAISKFAGITNVEGIIVLTVVLVGIASYINWLYLDLPTMPDIAGLRQYFIFYMILLMGGGFIIQKNYG